MNAKEMFEKLGYKKFDLGDSQYPQIWYSDVHNCNLPNIRFWLDDLKYDIYEDNARQFTIEIHKAITQQMKELGWLDE